MGWFAKAVILGLATGLGLALANHLIETARKNDGGALA